MEDENIKKSLLNLWEDPVIQRWLRDILAGWEASMAVLAETSTESFVLEPQTTLRRLNKNSKEKIIEIPQPEFSDTQQQLFDTLISALFRSEETVKMLVAGFQAAIPDITSEEPAASKLLSLTMEADKRIPYVAFLGLVPPKPDYSMRLVDCGACLVRAEKARGEIRAREVMDAFRRIAEHLYPRYLQTLLRLRKLKDGKWTNASGSTGNLLGAFSDRLRSEFSTLVEYDAAFFRNAAAHGNLEYLENDKVRIWNEDPPGTVKRGPEDFVVDALLERAETMFLHARSVERVMLAYWNRTLAKLVEQVMLPLWNEMWVGGEQVEARDETCCEAKSLFRPLAEFAIENGITEI